MNIIEKALHFATAAHVLQVRKTDGTPYIVHPVMVSMILARAGYSDAIIAAALVHDVVEDTSVSIELVRTEFGDEIGDIVAAVSEDMSLAWEDRKLNYLENVRRGPTGAHAVCLADKIHNLESLIDTHAIQGPRVWSAFTRGRDKKIWFERECYTMLMSVMGDNPLLARYSQLIITQVSLV